MATKYDQYDSPMDWELFELPNHDLEPLSDPWSHEADDYYSVWSCRLQCLLVLARRWDIVNGKDARPLIEDSMSPEEKQRTEERIDKWVQRNAEATYIIKRALSQDYNRHIPCVADEDRTAKAIWDRIRHSHVESEKGAKVLRVFQRMHGRRYEEGTTLMEFANGFLHDNMLLRLYGVGLSPEQLAMTIMQGLPWEDDTTRFAMWGVVDKIFTAEKEKGLDAQIRLIQALRGVDDVKKLLETREDGPAGNAVGRRPRKNRN